MNEVSSVYAEAAFSLGYFQPGRLLTELEMAKLATDVPKRSFRQRDWSSTELLAAFGDPSHEVVGGLTTVACYGCELQSVKWVCFDFARQLPGSDDWLPEELLLDFRNDYRNKMQLLPIASRWSSEPLVMPKTRRSRRRSD